MSKYSKLGYGDSANLDTAIENGIIDGKDIVITKDTSELYYIRDDKTKQAVRPRVQVFDSESEANEELNNDSSTYAGQTVMIKDEAGKYIPWVVQKVSDSDEFKVEAISVVSTGFAWCEF